MTAADGAMPLIDDATQYVTLGMGEEVFAVPVANVHEVLDLCAVTRVPNAPPSMRGMIDVRGRAVPVMDLRMKLGMLPVEATLHTRIVVVELEAEDGPVVIGMLADRVFEVATLDPAGTEPPPRIGCRWKSAFIRGIGRRGDRFVIILDLRHVLADEDIAMARDVA